MPPFLDLIIPLVSGYLAPILILVLFIALGFIFKFLMESYLMHLAKKTETPVDDIFIASFGRPITYLFIIAGVSIALQLMPIPWEIKKIIIPAVFVLAVIIIAHAVTKFFIGVFRYYSYRNESLKGVAPLVQRMFQFLIYFLALIFIFDFFGVSITPLLTTLGIAGIAVAFALQETLSNLFAGIYIMADRPIRVGDFVRLESGDEGYVEDISWRSTRIRLLSDDLIIIPNSKLANSVLHNYSLPSKRSAIIVPVGVSYGSDLAKVEDITLKVARDIMAKFGVEGEPLLRYKEFGESSINFIVRIPVPSYPEHYKIVHEFIKELHTTYAREGIEIPFPQRVVWMKRGE